MEKYFLPTFKPEVAKGFFHTHRDSLHIITHPKKPSWIVINDFGWKVIQLLNGNNSLLDVASKIKSQFDTDFETIKRDLYLFITAIEKSGILNNQFQAVDAPSPSVKSVFIHLTDKCNLHCKHCYAQNIASDCKELSDHELQAFLKKFYSEGGCAITMSGGEPLLRKNIREIFQLSSAAEIRLLTNGTLINEETASFIGKFNTFIQVSLDGSTEKIHDSIRGTGSFRAAIAGINNLKRVGLTNRINLCTTIMKQNMFDLPNILEFAQKEGIRYVRFLPLRRKGSAYDNWDEIHGGDYIQFYKFIYEKAIEQYPGIEISCGLSGYILDPKQLVGDKHWCPIGKNLIINTNGDVYPCVLFIDKQYKIGNIKENTIDKLRESPVLKALINARIERKEKIPKCSQCMWKHFCQGGCMGLSLECHGTIWDTDTFCEFRKNLYEKSVIKIAQAKGHHRHQDKKPDFNTECF
jgi:radical SAM protein with 4Fe4S-binding SPASM domain